MSRPLFDYHQSLRKSHQSVICGSFAKHFTGNVPWLIAVVFIVTRVPKGRFKWTSGSGIPNIFFMVFSSKIDFRKNTIQEFKRSIFSSLVWSYLFAWVLTFRRKASTSMAKSRLESPLPNFTTLGPRYCLSAQFSTTGFRPSLAITRSKLASIPNACLSSV